MKGLISRWLSLLQASCTFSIETPTPPLSPQKKIVLVSMIN